MKTFWRSLDGFEKWFIPLLFFISLGLRIGYLLEMHQTLFLTQLRLDELYHNNWAKSIATGNFIGDEIYFRAPLYPYLLGIYYYIFGHSYIVPRVIQHIIGSLNVILIYFLARKLFDQKVAVLSSILTSTYALIIYIEDKLLFESILIPQITIFLLSLYIVKEKSTHWKWFGVGILFGLICITRPIFMPFLLLLIPIIYFWYKRTIPNKKYILWMISTILGTTLVIAPITLRNYLIGDDFVLIASQGGINFYLGNNPEADGFSSTMPGPAGNRWDSQDIIYPVKKLLGRTPKVSEVDTYWREKAFNFIFNQPLDFIKLAIKKLYLFWNNIEIPNNGSFYLNSQFSKILTWLPVGFWLIGPLGLLGILLSWREKRARVITIFILCYSFSILLFFVCDRFRAPIIPLLCIFASFSIIKFFKYLKQNRVQTFIKLLVSLCVLGFIVNSNLYNFQKGTIASDLFSLGNLELSAGNNTKAISFYEKIPIDNFIQDVHLNWGVAEWRLGRINNAIQQFKLELKKFPQSYDALVNLAHLYLKVGSFDLASKLSQQAIQIKPYASTAYVIYCFTQIELKQYEKAESTLTTYIQTFAKNALYEESILAGIHLLGGKVDLAKQEYLSILNRLNIRAQPGYEPEFQYSKEYSVGGNWDEFRGKIFYSLGHIFVEQFNYDSALFYFNQATKSFPNLADAWLSKGNTLFEMKKMKEADSAFSIALQIDSTNSQAWYDYGLLLESMGKIENAKTAFKNALKYKPDFIEVEEELERLNNLP